MSLWGLGRTQADKRVGAIVVAAGSSLRMEGRDKIFALLDAKPLLYYSLSTLQQSPLVDEIVVVLNPQNLEAGQALVTAEQLTKVSQVCLGGPRRQDSAKAGLLQLGPGGWVIIHDAARPFLTIEMLQRGLEAAAQCGAAVAAVPVHDTTKRVDEKLTVLETVDRNQLWSVQTPQVFRRDLLENAFAKCTEDVTDEAMLLEKLNYEIKVFEGSKTNLKVTTSEDLAIAEAILKSRHL